MSYRVELPVFSGPLDLLLHLIKQQEVDIHDVAIAKILDQYLQHLAVLQDLDLADIGDFVVMASTLMEIKSRELLPGEEVTIEDDFDPRDDLIRRLLEYKRYRDVTRRFERLAQDRSRMVAPAVPPPKELEEDVSEQELDLGSVEIWTLTAAFAKLLEETGGPSSMHVGIERRDSKYYTATLLERVRQAPEVAFLDLFDRDSGRYGLIGLFGALLELMKQGFIRAHQDASYAPITVAFVGPENLTVDEVLAGERWEDGEDVDEQDDDPLADAVEEAGEPGTLSSEGSSAPSASGENGARGGNGRTAPSNGSA
ncbi:MAG: segregation/condensation protein A [Planctomycetota bacterium]